MEGTPSIMDTRQTNVIYCHQIRAESAPMQIRELSLQIRKALLSLSLVSASAWAGPFTTLPEEHWSYAVIEESRQLGLIGKLAHSSGSELSQYEMAQLVNEAVAKWALHAPLAPADQQKRLAASLRRLIDELALTFQTIGISPENLKEELGSPDTQTKLPDGRPVLPSALPRSAERRPSRKDGNTPARTPNAIGFGSPSDSVHLQSIEYRLQLREMMQAMMGEAAIVEARSLAVPFRARMSLLSQPSERSLPLLGSSRDSPESALFPEFRDTTPSLLHSLTADFAVPLNERFSLVAGYERSIPPRAAARLTGNAPVTSAEAVAWHAGAVFSPGRLRFGAALHSVDEEYFSEELLDGALMLNEVGLPPLRPVGRVEGVSGFVGYSRGNVGLEGRIVGYEDDGLGVLMRYTGQLEYRGLDDQLALGLTLTHSLHNVKDDIQDTLNTSFGVGYSLTSAAQFQLIYGLRSRYSGTLLDDNVDRTHVVAGRFSVRF
ncbi:MAG: hypothetical protein AUJ92_05660 [Armatimonadetes bacterium CG2_30_59_28]|nr:MAG: hypothetical protein AUJ92_05660 [Armatimonadetes bacterium CG2_30_59_28]